MGSCKSRIRGVVYIPKANRISPPFIIALVSSLVSDTERKREIGWWRRKGTYRFFNLMSCFSEHLGGGFFRVCDYYLSGCPSSCDACVGSGEEEGQKCEYSYAPHCWPLFGDC